MLFFRDIGTLFHQYYPTLIDTSVFDDQPGDKYDRTTRMGMGINHSYRGWHEWEYSFNESIYLDISINEILNLIELATFNGEQVEYNILLEQHQGSLDTFSYGHAINDPPPIDIVIIRRHPTGVKMIVQEGL